MDDHFKIRTMRKEEVSIAIQWAKQEGWNPGIHDATTYYSIDHQGFFLGELHNEVIAVSTGVCYDANFAFWGFYIVKPDYRGQGYGTKITEHCLAHMNERNIGLDGVVQNVPIYESLGFHVAHRNERYKKIATKITEADPHVYQKRRKTPSFTSVI